MNVFSATESDLALRIRRTLGGAARRMGTRSRILAAVLLCVMAAITLPFTGIAQTKDGIDWDAVRTTAPENWSQDLKDQIAAAGYDVEAIAERVRQGQAATRDGTASDSDRGTRDGAAADLDAIGRRIRAAVESGKLTSEEGREKMEAARQAAGKGNADKLHADKIWQAAMATDPAAWSDRLKAAILELKPDSTIEEIAEGIRQRQQMADTKRDEEKDKLREFQRGVIARAMEVAPDEWSDRLKAAIERADWDLDEFTEGIRQRQAGESESVDLPLSGVDQTTAVEQRSWGQIKEEINESK